MIEIKQTINHCTNLINTQVGRFLKPMRASTPEFTAMPKLHKESTPIRPLIDYTTAPSFKIANIINQNIIIKNYHSIKNNIQFIDSIQNIQILNQYKIASFDVTNLYMS